MINLCEENYYVYYDTPHIIFTLFINISQRIYFYDGFHKDLNDTQIFNKHGDGVVFKFQIY